MLVRVIRRTSQLSQCIQGLSRASWRSRTENVPGSYTYFRRFSLRLGKQILPLALYSVLTISCSSGFLPVGVGGATETKTVEPDESGSDKEGGGETVETVETVEPVSMPTADIVAGSYSLAQTVTLSSATEGAVVYYTTGNGSQAAPTCASTTGTISIMATTTVKAIACKTGYTDSAVATFAYIINGAAATPTADIAAGGYGPAQTVTLNSATSGAVVHYNTGDGSQADPTCASSTGSVSVTATTTVKAIACEKSHLNSAVATIAYIINGPTAAPTDVVAASTCGAVDTVTLSSATDGAVVHYTSGDGTQAAPTCASSTGTLSLTATTTVKAISCKTDYSDSAVATFSYTVDVQDGLFCGGAGSTEVPYKICSLATLANVANHLDASFIVTRDIDASTMASGLGWAPIGSNATPFTGALDGQDHRICGLTINRPTTDYIGLFGAASATSVLQDLSLQDVAIVGQNYTGGLVGKDLGEIHNVSVKGSVQGTSNVGGMVGYLTGAVASIVDSNANTIAVSGTAYLGGLAGQSDGSASITRSWSSGTVTGDPVVGWKVGGLVGRLSKGTISHSYSSANVSANNQVGGLVGMFYQWGAGLCTIEYSHASGSVTAVSAAIGATDGFGVGAGGLAGVGGDCLLIQKSYATGNVTSEHTGTEDKVGGLVGAAYWKTQTIDDSYATGNVSSAGGQAGGILGYSNGFNINRSYATGGVTAPMAANAGGLVASGSAALYNSFATGVVSGTATTIHGGLVGVKSSTLTNSYWLKPDGSPFTCVGNSVGDTGCTEESVISFFSTHDGALFSTWNFTAGTGVWEWPAESGALPRLRE